ncbi:MAG: hypothetical protein O7G29_08875 [Acidobacteria bacterium]|nr:hypothetical protein [Acidobacteriota bacterium]
MSDSCCSPSQKPLALRSCPVSDFRGKPVEWLTIAALAARRVPPRQDFWMCKDPDCDVVYFGEDGTLLLTSDLHVIPSFKGAPSRNDLVCYCFLYSCQEIEDELRASGETTIFDRITAEVKAGNCACEVRNPSGQCCLGVVKKAIQETRETLQLMQ